MKGKARFSCKFLADQHGVGSKKHPKKGRHGGGSNESIHVYVSRAIEKGRTFILTIKNKGVAEWKYQWDVYLRTRGEAD